MSPCEGTLVATKFSKQNEVDEETRLDELARLSDPSKYPELLDLAMLPELL